MEMFEMKKNMENAIAQNITTSSENHNVKDMIRNMIKLIKQENWEKVMQNSDSLFEWLDLNCTIRVVFEIFKKYVEDKKSIFNSSLVNIANFFL